MPAVTTQANPTSFAFVSYQDYRFRAPNVMFFRASFEHSIYKWPVGFTAMVDEGKVAEQRGDIDFSHLVHSYSAGLTLRAGGFGVAPAHMNHYAWTRTGAVIQINLMGPFALTYVNPADDPSKAAAK